MSLRFAGPVQLSPLPQRAVRDAQKSSERRTSFLRPCALRRPRGSDISRVDYRKIRESTGSTTLQLGLLSGPTVPCAACVILERPRASGGRPSYSRWLASPRLRYRTVLGNPEVSALKLIEPMGTGQSDPDLATIRNA